MAIFAAEAAIGCRALSLGGHDDFNQGQLSFRVPRSDEMWIKEANIGFSECRKEHFLSAQVDHAQAAPALAPPELPLHQAIYQERDDVNAVVHSHAPHGLVFGALREPVVALGHEGALLADHAEHYEITSNTVLDIDVGRSIAKTLRSGVAVFLVNHGTVVVGKSVRHAVVFALMLERACRLQLLAMSTGRPFSVSNVKDIRAKREFIFADLSVRSYWDYTKRDVLAKFVDLTT